MVHDVAAEGGGKWHWKIIFNGYADELAYERGTIDTSLPFEELKKVSRVNDRAIVVGDSPEFSRLIRGGAQERKGGKEQPPCYRSRKPIWTNEASSRS